MADWVVTVAATVDWHSYALECAAVKGWSQEMKFRVPFKPTARSGDRCFIVYKGKIRGWMEIVCAELSPSFICTTTSKRWPKGWYINRSGPFHKVDGPAMRGFQGIRRLKVRIP